MKHNPILRYKNASLAWKIRISYLVMMIPLMLIIAVLLINLWKINSTYDEMIRSAVEASEFSLDFKKEFDDEAYLLIVESKSIEECQMDNMLVEANNVVDELEKITTSKDNQERLESAKKYLENLSTYEVRIEANLRTGDKYSENMTIWENDIQIVTNLLKETMSEYIYYEVKDLQIAKDNYQDSYLTMVNGIVIALILVATILILLSFYIPRTISRPISELNDVTKEIAAGNLSARSTSVSGGEVQELSDSLNVMIDRINDLLSQVTTEQTRLRTAELELLQAQINPHFLYNTLDTIVWLAEGDDQKKVVGMVKSLSEFFRTSLSQGKELVTIKEELLHVRSYLEIQQVRYQDIMEFEIVVPEELYSCLIPKITLQPLVENALYHGIKNKREGGRITITGRLEDGFAIVEVLDTGIGMTEERLLMVNEKLQGRASSKDEIYGLSNVCERIRLKFGDAYGIKASSTYGLGTTMQVFLPLDENYDESLLDS